MRLIGSIDYALSIHHDPEQNESIYIPCSTTVGCGSGRINVDKVVHCRWRGLCLPENLDAELRKTPIKIRIDEPVVEGCPVNGNKVFRNKYLKISGYFLIPKLPCAPVEKKKEQPETEQKKSGLDPVSETGNSKSVYSVKKFALFSILLLFLGRRDKEIFFRLLEFISQNFIYLMIQEVVNF